MRFDSELRKYMKNGVFSFNVLQLFKNECNAPIDQSGVYLIYKVIDEKEILIYIGSSGQKNKDGTLKIRKGGIRDRLINGYHSNKFGQLKRVKRHIAFPQQMQIERIDELKIYWWVTYDSENLDFPTEVEAILRNKYLSEYHKLPDWHQQ